jgi:hypothetical protein
MIKIVYYGIDLPDIPFFTIRLQREMIREDFMTYLPKLLGDKSRHGMLQKERMCSASAGLVDVHMKLRQSIGALGCLDSHLAFLKI